MGANANNGGVASSGKAGGVDAADEDFGNEMQWNGQPPTDREFPGDM